MRQLNLGISAEPPCPRPRSVSPKRPFAPRQLGLFAAPAAASVHAEVEDAHLSDIERRIDTRTQDMSYYPPSKRQASEPKGDVSKPSEQTPWETAQATIQGQVRIEQFLRQFLGPRVMVQLTQNRSTMISFSVKKGVRYVRLHAIFAQAPDHILGAITEFVSTKTPGPKTVWLIDKWIEAHRGYVKKQGRKPQVLPQGEVHDLQQIFDRINRQYFKERVKARITWSRAARGQKRSSIRMGSFSEHEKLIRIHPALDQKFVPEYFVASVVFHEMLHELHGVYESSDGTRRVHTPAFRRDEARFAEYAEARAWEAKNLRRLLRY